ncbi:hypothetical protein [Bordetella sp. 2513F-2]
MTLAFAPYAWLAVAAVLIFFVGLAWLLGRGGPRGADGRRSFRLRPVRRLVGLLLLALACVSAMLAFSLVQFQRLVSDRPIMDVRMVQQGEREYLVSIQPEGREPREYTLRGDQWQVDARMIRWRLPALLAGVPPVYRLERLSGRYRDVEQERTGERSVHDLQDGSIPDLADLKRVFPNWLPFVDVEFGSAAYMPMLDGARYRVYLDPRGALFIRPADAETEAALAGGAGK